MANLITDYDERKEWFYCHVPLNTCKWHKVRLVTGWGATESELNAWINSSCSGKAVRWIASYYFEKESDKLMFVLKWANICQLS